MTKLASNRRWWMALVITVVLAAPAALALTTITISGRITYASNKTSGAVKKGDRFQILLMFDETQVGRGKQTLKAGDAGFRFKLKIGDKIRHVSADDLFGSPLLTLKNGRFNALQFLSKNYDDLGPDAFTKLNPVGPLKRLSGLLEILGAKNNRPLVLGRFTGAKVSVD